MLVNIIIKICFFFIYTPSNAAITTYPCRYVTLAGLESATSHLGDSWFRHTATQWSANIIMSRLSAWWYYVILRQRSNQSTGNLQVVYLFVNLLAASSVTCLKLVIHFIRMFRTRWEMPVPVHIDGEPDPQLLYRILHYYRINCNVTLCTYIKEATKLMDAIILINWWTITSFSLQICSTTDYVPYFITGQMYWFYYSFTFSANAVQ